VSTHLKEQHARKQRTPARRRGQTVIASVRTNLRMVPRVKKIISEAARLKRTTLSNFMIESSIEAAERILTDRTRFVLSDADWKAFTNALDAPAKHIPALRRLLKIPSVFEKK
jgi:uncharacterized protein (DUF1778 family)